MKPITGPTNIEPTKRSIVTVFQGRLPCCRVAVVTLEVSGAGTK